MEGTDPGHSSIKELMNVYGTQAREFPSTGIRAFDSLPRMGETSSDEIHNPIPQQGPDCGVESMDMPFQGQFLFPNTIPWSNQAWMLFPQDSMNFPAQPMPGLAGSASQDFFNGSAVNWNSSLGGHTYLPGPHSPPGTLAPLTQNQHHTTLQQPKPTFRTEHQDPAHNGSWNGRSPYVKLGPKIRASIDGPSNSPSMAHRSSRYSSKATSHTGCAFEK